MDGGVFTKQKTTASSIKNVGKLFNDNKTKYLKVLSTILDKRSQYIDRENGVIRLDEIMKHTFPWRGSLSDSTMILYSLIKANATNPDISEKYELYGKVNFSKLYNEIKKYKTNVLRKQLKEGDIKPNKTHIRFFYINHFIENYKTEKNFINILKKKEMKSIIKNSKDMKRVDTIIKDTKNKKRLSIKDELSLLRKDLYDIKKYIIKKDIIKKKRVKRVEKYDVGKDNQFLMYNNENKNSDHAVEEQKIQLVSQALPQPLINTKIQNMRIQPQTKILLENRLKNIQTSTSTQIPTSTPTSTTQIEKKNTVNMNNKVNTYIKNVNIKEPNHTILNNVDHPEKFKKI